jgi:hypothetical protein
MKVLLDECIPRKLKYSLPDHECHTVPEAGLAGKKNGVLLGLAEGACFESACGSPSVGARTSKNHETGAQRRDPSHRWREAGVLNLGVGGHLGSQANMQCGRRVIP